MIFDTIANLKNYGAEFEKIQEFISSNDLKTLDAARYDIADGIFLKIQDYKTKTKSNNLCEIHKKYIDLQFMVTGSEKMLYGTYAENVPMLPYNEELDIAHHNAGHCMDCVVPEGWFCVFFPGEYHKPGICVSEPADVRKALFKIEYK